MSLSQGHTVRRAFDQAVAAVGLLADVGHCWEMPKLHHRTDIDPDQLTVVNALIYTQ